MGRKRTKEPRKPVVVTVCERAATPEPYGVVDAVVRRWRGDLGDASVLAVFVSGWRKDRDGRLRLGKIKRPDELTQGFDQGHHDFILFLNQDAWGGFQPDEKLALVDHYLFRARVVTDKNGDPRRDEAGRLRCRLRTWDFVGGVEVLNRHKFLTVRLEQVAIGALKDAGRPLLQGELAKAAPGPDGSVEVAALAAAWKMDAGVQPQPPIRVAITHPKHAALLVQAGIDTVPKLQQRISEFGDTWNRGLGVKGLGPKAKASIERELRTIERELRTWKKEEAK